MDYQSIVFREFTPESFRRIERYRQEEAERMASERLQQQTIFEDNHRSSKNSAKHATIKSRGMPNKELAVGQTLPRALQTKFPAELIGKPIEEIDWYYRTEYVRHKLGKIRRIVASFLFRWFSGLRGGQSK